MLAFQTDVLTVFFSVQAQHGRCADSKPGSAFFCMSLALFVKFWSVLCAKNTGKKQCSSVSETTGPEDSSLKVIMHEKDFA